MQALYGIAMDVHSYQTATRVETPTGRVREIREVQTSIPHLLEVIERTPRPRALIFEEGPLAEWLVQQLHPHVDKLVVAETRRNAYVAKDGDKSDAIDAEKLLCLFRGGFVKPVHHNPDASRVAFKALVRGYHKQTAERVRRANQTIWALRERGVVVTEKAFAAASDRQALWDRLPRGRTTRRLIEQAFEDYDLMARQQALTLDELERQAKRIDQVRRFKELPGIGWIRASTFYVYVDTPFRFRAKAALHKYIGIGLTGKQSGSGPAKLGVSPACHRPLKNMVLGAAQSAARGRDNPFERQYRRLTLEQGKSLRIACRTVARSLSAVMWGMFKSGERYRPERVGLAR